MFYYLSEYTEWFSPLRVFQYTTFRAVFAALTALLMCVVLGPWLIRRLVEMKLQQPIRGEDDLRELAQDPRQEGLPDDGRHPDHLGGGGFDPAVGASDQSARADLPGDVDLARRRSGFSTIGRRCRRGNPTGCGRRRSSSFRSGWDCSWGRCC